MLKNISKTKMAFILLLVSTILFAFSTPILKVLIIEGKALGLKHTEAISFCNVLFIGNLCAGLITLVSFPKKKMYQELRHINRRTFWLIAISCILAIIYPSLIFFALEKTTVTRIVLISRFEGIVYALMAWVFLKNTLKLPEIIGYLIIAIGVGIILFSSGMQVSTADILVLSACVFYGLSEVFSFMLLDSISLPTFIFVRNFVSAIVFFIIATSLFGPEHFAEAFYGDLWIAMLIYAGITIVIGQLMWFRGAKDSNPIWPANFALITPFFTILFAYLLLHEVPDLSEWIAIVIIAIGIGITKVIGSLQRSKLQPMGIDCGLIGR